MNLGPGVDRISALPSHLQAEIISLLPIKEAASTSLLSKEWKKTWKWIPHLEMRNINQNLIDRIVGSLEVERIESFKISLPNMSSFTSSIHEDHMEGWVTIAVDLETKRMDFDLPCPRYEFGTLLFRSSVLVVLKLKDCGKIKNIGSVQLPSLKTMHFSTLEIAGLSGLIQGCTALEYLRLERCMTDSDSLQIRSSSLKGLVVVNLLVKAFFQIQGSYSLIINTPNLEYFHMNDHLPVIECEEFLVLKMARLRFRYMGPDNGAPILHLLSHFSTLEHLTLDSSSCAMAKDLDLFGWNPIFPRLTTLKLCGQSGLLSKFLRASSPTLQQLEFRQKMNDHLMQGERSIIAGELTWRVPQVPTFASLVRIELGNILCTTDGRNIVRFLLERANNLQVIKIQAPLFNSELLRQFVKKLRSDHPRIEFHVQPADSEWLGVMPH